MYTLPPTGSHPAPLDFNTPRRTDTVADTPDSDFRPRDEFPVPALDTGALLSAIGLPDRAVREILKSSSGPDR